MPMKKDRVLSFIVELLNTPESNEGEFSLGNDSVKYLLNQILRQLSVPIENRYISQAAIILWNEICDDDIEKYGYRSRVIPIRSSLGEAEFFAGNHKECYKSHRIQKHEGFVFKDVFHDEHIISLKVIVHELLSLQRPCEEDAFAIIQKISICRMLKTEDRIIPSKSNRPFDVKAVFENIYPKSIIIKKYCDR